MWRACALDAGSYRLVRTLPVRRHGGTQCQQWLIRAQVFGWSDDAIDCEGKRRPSAV